MHLLSLGCVLGAAVLALGRGHAADQSPLLPPGIPSSGSGDADGDTHSSEFHLAHIFHHGTSRYPHLHRKHDVDPSAQVWLRDDNAEGKHLSQASVMPTLRARSRSMSIQRLADRSPEHIEDLLAEARWFGRAVDLPASAWTVEEISAPNVTDKETVLTLARMAADAYVETPGGPEWEELGEPFNRTLDFGWEKEGIRGHVFTDKKNETVIISLKGTTMAVFDGAGTTTNDKLNDNLFFGCCCGEGSWFTSHACSCQTATYTCNTTCVQKTLRDKNRYYAAAQELYHNVTAIYPDSQIWMIGHSLGGSTSSLVAATYQLPSVTFEAPGEAMAAQRLGLPTPPGYRTGDADDDVAESASYHFGHNADPLYTGECGSLCYVAGYTMESMCHTGYECIYNLTGDGWSQSLSTHRINFVLHSVIEHYNDTAECTVNRDCTDCFQWKYFESNSSSGTSTSVPPSTSFTRTRTETCKTPGWWGCLDETTGMTSTTSTTTSTSTSTCKTPGWFGCKDPPPTTTSIGVFWGHVATEALAASATGHHRVAAESRPRAGPEATAGSDDALRRR